VKPYVVSLEALLLGSAFLLSELGESDIVEAVSFDSAFDSAFESDEEELEEEEAEPLPLRA
jgi:hypothetical protein